MVEALSLLFFVFHSLTLPPTSVLSRLLLLCVGFTPDLIPQASPPPYLPRSARSDQLCAFTSNCVKGTFLRIS